MKRFRVTVNGETYEVDIEEIGAAPSPLPAQSTISSPWTPPARVVVGAGSRQFSLQEDAGAIRSPMPGTINQVRVRVGDQVNAGDVLFTLEAMKMENMIHADIAGVVKDVRVVKGQAVNGGDTLAVIA